MTPDKNALRTYFAKLGLETEIADVYLALHDAGPQTMSELSRSSGIERTRLYRLIDQLLDSALVEVETRNKRGLLKPAPVANLRILISKREQELQGLQDGLGLVEQVLGRNSLQTPALRLQTYTGPAGIRQLLTNVSRARGEVCSVAYKNIEIGSDARFFEVWAADCNKADIRFRAVTGHVFESEPATWYKGAATRRLDNWQARRGDKAAFPITFSTFVYDDVTAWLHWTSVEAPGGDVSGLEIHNQQIADAQRKYFEMQWLAATA